MDISEAIKQIFMNADGTVLPEFTDRVESVQNVIDLALTQAEALQKVTDQNEARAIELEKAYTEQNRLRVALLAYTGSPAGDNEDDDEVEVSAEAKELSQIMEDM